MSSTCFESEVLSSGRWLYKQVWYIVFYKTAYTDACRT